MHDLIERLSITSEGTVAAIHLYGNLIAESLQRGSFDIDILSEHAPESMKRLARDSGYQMAELIEMIAVDSDQYPSMVLTPDPVWMIPQRLDALNSEKFEIPEPALTY